MTLEVENLVCPPDWTCSPGWSGVLEEENPGFPYEIPWATLCDSPPDQPPAVFVERARFTDADGVQTEWEEYNATCGVPGPARAVDGAPPPIIGTGTRYVAH